MPDRIADVTFFEVVSCVQIHGHSCVLGPAGHGSVWMVSTLTLKFSNPLEGLLPQGCSVTRNGDLAGTFDVRNAAVKRRNKLVQMTERVCPINFSGVLLGH
jgi:hypothetical protein